MRSSNHLQICIKRLKSNHASTFKANEAIVELTDAKKPMPASTELKFGAHFTDHMLTIDWNAKGGWEKPIIGKLENISLHPASTVFHYAVGIFEGMKAMRDETGRIRLFRPIENMKRFRQSAERSTLPTFDPTELLELLKRLIFIDKDWVPSGENQSLYIRPTMIGTSPILGVSSPDKAKLFIINGPVGFYYQNGFKPLTLYADPKYIRSTYGGCGGFKMSSNYSPTLYVQNIAASKGCDQVLWLHGKDELLTEVGTMNLFVYLTTEAGEKQVVTHPLDGLILPGVTRDSIIQLLKQAGHNVLERELSMKEFVKAHKEKRVHEVFGCGTACVVSDVGKIIYKDEILTIPTPTESLSREVLYTFDKIRTSKEDHPWMVPVD